jgi:DNA-directed RNA polymerase specialized sigma24 family protein
MSRRVWPSERERFDEAASNLLDAVRAGSAASIPPADLQFVFDWIQATLRRGYGLSESDAADATQEALLSLLETGEHPRRSHADIGNPAAYLTWLARNRAIDRFRSAAHRTSAPLEAAVEISSGDDDAIAALLDRDATAAQIAAALETAIAAQADLAVRIVTVWLDLAATSGAAPSSRAVAAVADVSHTSVNQALRRFATYFPSSGARSSNE